MNEPESKTTAARLRAAVILFVLAAAGSAAMAVAQAPSQKPVIIMHIGSRPAASQPSAEHPGAEKPAAARPASPSEPTALKPVSIAPPAEPPSQPAAAPAPAVAVPAPTSEEVRALRVASAATNKPLTGYTIGVVAGRGVQAPIKNRTPKTVDADLRALEASANLRVAQIAEAYLKHAGAVVVPLYKENAPAGPRVHIATPGPKMDFVLSIHHSYSIDPKENVTAAYYYPGNDPTLEAAARRINETLSAGLGVPATGPLPAGQAIAGKEGQPTILLILSLVSNPDEVIHVADVAYNKLEAEAILRGAVNFARESAGTLRAKQPGWQFAAGPAWRRLGAAAAAAEPTRMAAATPGAEALLPASAPAGKKTPTVLELPVLTPKPEAALAQAASAKETPKPEGATPTPAAIRPLASPQATTPTPAGKPTPGPGEIPAPMPSPSPREETRIAMAQPTPSAAPVPAPPSEEGLPAPRPASEAGPIQLDLGNAPEIPAAVQEPETVSHTPLADVWKQPVLGPGKAQEYALGPPVPAPAPAATAAKGGATPQQTVLEAGQAPPAGAAPSAAASPADEGTFPFNPVFPNPVAAPIDQTWLFGEEYENNPLKRGVSFAAPAGTPVHAVAEGTVVEVNFGSEPAMFLPYARSVLIEHDQPFKGEKVYTMYGQMAEVQATQGQKVKRGTTIGKTGAPYDTVKNFRGTEFEFEVRIGGKASENARNPEVFIDHASDNTGMIIGRIVDKDFRALPGRRIDGAKKPEQSHPYYSYSLSYAPQAASSWWQENFVIGDVTPGTYELSFPGGAELKKSVTVQAGKITYITVVE